MPDDFDLDAALGHLDASTRTLVRVRPAEEIRVRGSRRHRARVAGLSAAVAVAAVAVLVLGTGALRTGSHRSAPPASRTTPSPTATPATVRTVSDASLLISGNLPRLQGGSWTLGATRDELPITDPAHSCETSTLNALGAVEARQRDWTFVTPGGSGTRYRQVVAAYATAAEAESAQRASSAALSHCTPRGLQHPTVAKIASGLVAMGPRGEAAGLADVYSVSGTVSGTEGRFEYVAIGRRANAVVLMVLTQDGGQDSNIERSVYTQPVVAALDQLATYDATAPA